jgi:hypothetical protein
MALGRVGGGTLELPCMSWKESSGCGKGNIEPGEGRVGGWTIPLKSLVLLIGCSAAVSVCRDVLPAL